MINVLLLLGYTLSDVFFPFFVDQRQLILRNGNEDYILCRVAGRKLFVVELVPKRRRYAISKNGLGLGLTVFRIYRDVKMGTY